MYNVQRHCNLKLDKSEPSTDDSPSKADRNMPNVKEIWCPMTTRPLQLVGDNSVRNMGPKEPQKPKGDVGAALGGLCEILCDILCEIFCYKKKYVNITQRNK